MLLSSPSESRSEKIGDGNFWHKYFKQDRFPREDKKGGFKYYDKSAYSDNLCINTKIYWYVKKKN